MAWFPVYGNRGKWIYGEQSSIAELIWSYTGRATATPGPVITFYGDEWRRR